MEWSIIINNRKEEIPIAIDFFEQIGGKLCLSHKILMHVSLVIDEILTNVVLYGYENNRSGTIKLDICVVDDVLYLTFEDHGVEFDMTNELPINISLPIEKRPIGGVGIHLAKTIMDTIIYNRLDNTNVLKMSKKIVSYENIN